MQSHNNIPWNVTPRNGINAFFSEESYARWFGRESHESRLADNLRKVGITLPPTEPKKPDLDIQNTDLEARKPEKEVKNPDQEVTSKIERLQQNLKAETDATVKDTIAQAVQTTRPRKYPVKHSLDQKNVSASSTASTEFSLKQEKECESKPSTLLPDEAFPVQGDASSGNSGDYERPEEEIVRSNVGSSKNLSRVHKSDVTKTEHTSGQTIEEPVVEEMAISSEIHTETASPHSPPSTIEQSENSPVKAEQPADSKKLANDLGTKQQLNYKTWRDVPTRHIDGNAPRPDVPSSLSSDNKRPTSKEDIKRLKAENLFYFNQKDRTDKYLPNIFRMKPKKKKSQLTLKEQRFFFNMNRDWGTGPPCNPLPGEPNEADEQYQSLAPVVKMEQTHYQSYLKYAANKCEADYRYIHPDADKYITAKLQGKKRRVWAYPRYYKNVGKICLRDIPLPADPCDVPTLQFVRQLVEMGHVPKLVLPSIVPGCPQPCTPTSFKEVSSVCPPIRDKAQGPLVWDHQECSCDINMEQLAVPNKCDIALTATSMRYLIDNQGYHSKFWDMPITVKEYNVTEGNSNVIHRVVYLDKPLLPTTEYLMRDRHLMYQKYALKTAALRPKQKMVVFSKIKPVANIIKAPEQETVVKEIKNWEKNVEETLIVCSEDENSGNESDDACAEKNAKAKAKKMKRWKKKKKGAQVEDELGVKGVGVFNIEKDIDELEMFGMDTSPKIKPANTNAGEVEAKGKATTRLSMESDLELLKGITSLAKKDVKRVPDVCKQMVKPAVETSKDTRSVASSARDVVQYNKPISKDSVSVDRESDTEQSGSDEETEVEITQSVVEKKEPEKEATNEVPESETESKQAIRQSRKLSVENVSSLSGMMQRMSTVKAKLQQRNQSKINPTETTHKTDGTSSETLSTPYQTRGAATVRQSNKTPAHNVDITPVSSDSDSDADSDGLVIDVPEGSLVKRPNRSRNKRNNAGISEAVSHETIHSPPASPIQDIETPQSQDLETPQSPEQETPQSPGIETPQSPGLETPKSPVLDTPFSPDKLYEPSGAGLNKPCVIIPCEEANGEEVVRDYSTVAYDQSTNGLPSARPTESSIKKEHKEVAINIKTEMKQEPESSAPVTRGSKRRSSDNAKPEMTGTRKILRSSVSKEVDESMAGDIEDETGAIEEPSITTRGRGRKRELTKERLTRSRSVSMESQGTSPARATRRVTRHSLESSRASLESILLTREATKSSAEQSEDPEVPVKRKRGRPPKKSTEDPKVTSKDNCSIPKNNDAHDQISPNLNTGRSQVGFVNEEQPIPRRRGRPPRKSTDDSKVIVDENSIILQSSAVESCGQDQTKTDLKNVTNTEQTGVDTKSDGNSTLSDFKRLRRDSVHEDQPMPKRRGRPPKKTSQSLVETDKVQEMREALKRKIATAEEEKAKKLAEEERARKEAEAKDLKKVASALVGQSNISKQGNTDITILSQVNSANLVNNKAAVPSQGSVQMPHGYQAMAKRNVEQSSQAMAKQQVSQGSGVNANQNLERGSQALGKQNFQQCSKGTTEQTAGMNQPHGKTSATSANNGQFYTGQAGQSWAASAGGLDSILNMQSNMLKSPEVKGSSHEQFASQHGMQHAVFPLEGNLTYNLWSLGDTKILVRCSYHGHSNPQGIVHVTPKIEYQPCFGYERDTINETCKNWISVYLRPNSTLVRARINPYNSEVMMLETVNFKDLIPPDSGFKPLKAFADMDTIFKELKTLTPGQYVLRNNPWVGKMTVLQATDEAFRSYDLYKHHSPFHKGREGRVVQWQPIDTRLLLPHHKSRQLVPCLYPPSDQEGQQFVPKKKRGKKKKKNKEQEQD